MADKLDSNLTSLSYAEEDTLRTFQDYVLAVAASAVLTFSGTGSDGDTITVGSRTYTLRTAFSSGPTIADEILIGASASATCYNFYQAINAAGTEGTEYSTGTVAHPDVYGIRSTGSSAMRVRSLTPGAADNSIATTEVGTNTSWNTATLTGGVDAVNAPPMWHTLEPNSYSDFGGQIKTVARKPINPSRQRKKGVVTDLDANGGFNQDLTFNNMTRLLQGFLFADIREKFSTDPMNGTHRNIATVNGASDYYGSPGHMGGFMEGHLVFGKGFGVAGNNGLHLATATTNNSVSVVTDTVGIEVTPPEDASLSVVGYQFEAGTVGFFITGSMGRLHRVSGTFDMTSLGLIPGEWVFLGGDAAATNFPLARGFARVLDVNENNIFFDKTDWEPVAVVAGSKTIQIFFGSVIKNEKTPSLIKRRTYHLERQLGSDADGVMSEYLVGAVPNDLTLNYPMTDKVTMDLAFVALDNVQRDGATGVIYGDRPALLEEDAYNTSNDFSRIKMSIVDPTTSYPAPLFAFCTELSLKVQNNASPDKALGVLGAFDVSIGTFEVSGKVTAYFANMDAVTAVRNNDDITLDVALVKDNKGIVFDIPLLALGDGRLQVDMDKSIMLPLDTNAAESSFGHTLLINVFSYLPDLAG